MLPAPLTRQNCIHFVKDQVEIEKEHALKLAQEVEEEKDIISRQHDKIITTVEEINQQFDIIFWH